MDRIALQNTSYGIIFHAIVSSVIELCKKWRKCGQQKVLPDHWKIEQGHGGEVMMVGLLSRQHHIHKRATKIFI